MIKVLFLASNPEGTSQLKLDEEIRSITQKIRAAEYRDEITLIPVLAARPDDLLQALNQHKPQIVHFSGHGNTSGQIILTDDDRQPKTVSIEALKMLFSTLKGNIQLVILNSCYSKVQAKAIKRTIGCVIGMNDSISDEAAITFSASFYRALGFGESIKSAFDQGVTSLLLEGIQESTIPELLARSDIKPDSIILVNKDTFPKGMTPALNRG
jgi:hypothetical protein